MLANAGALPDLSAGEFLIDHDQNLSLQGSVTCDLGARGASVGANVRYDAGPVSGATPDQLAGVPDDAWAIPFIRVTDNTALNPDRVRSRTVWDLSAGADVPNTPLSIQVDLLNAFDKRGVYNILSVFGGTHVIPPRTLAVRLRCRLSTGAGGLPAQ